MVIPPCQMASRLAVIVGCLALVGGGLGSGCGEQFDPQDPTEYYGQPQNAEADDPIGFTTQPYDFTGETSISDLAGLIPPRAFVWYGASPMDGYPVGDGRVLDKDCDTTSSYLNKFNKVDTLPTHIEGVVTLHPRYFQKVSLCGQDQRYYGSFFLQDSSGGILVLKDSRIADFSVGDRVKIRVRGIMTAFGQPAVFIYDDQQVVDPADTEDVYYKDIDRDFTADDIGKVRRIRGTVVGEPTNNNFNEVTVEGDDGGLWHVSVDRELGNRGVPIFEDDSIQFTGPVADSFGLTLLVGSLGQIEWLDE